MAVLRMDHAGIVVEDLAAAVEFFVELGLAPLGEFSVEGEWVDRIVGLEGVRTKGAMLGTPDGRSKVELVEFQSPPAAQGDLEAPSNMLGLRHLTFAVEGVDDVVERLERHGAALVGEIVRYGDAYRLCYLRGPAGIIVELAEPLG